MTIPVYILGAICLVSIVYWSDRLAKRAVFIICCCAPVGVGYLICVGTANPHAGYAGMFILVIGKICPYPNTNRQLTHEQVFTPSLPLP